MHYSKNLRKKLSLETFPVNGYIQSFHLTLLRRKGALASNKKIEKSHRKQPSLTKNQTSAKPSIEITQGLFNCLENYLATI